jgi:hypothetical protein
VVKTSLGGCYIFCNALENNKNHGFFITFYKNNKKSDSRSDAAALPPLLFRPCSAAAALPPTNLD